MPQIICNFRVEIYFNEYDHAVYNNIFMDIVSNCYPIWTHYTDSESTSLCSFSLVLRT